MRARPTSIRSLLGHSSALALTLLAVAGCESGTEEQSLSSTASGGDLSEAPIATSRESRGTGGLGSTEETAAPPAVKDEEASEELPKDQTEPVEQEEVVSDPIVEEEGDLKKESDPTTEIVSEERSALWYYVQRESGALVRNVTSEEEGIRVESNVNLEEAAVPWSPDGTQLAQIAEGEVVFYALGEEATITASYPATDFTSVVGWIPGYGPLLLGERDGLPLLGAMKPDGTELILAEGIAATNLESPLIAPVGGEVLWASRDEDNGYRLWHSRFSEGAASAPEVVLHYPYNHSPILFPKWSPNGKWISFGVAGGGEEDDSGIFVWTSGMEAPAKVSPEGAPFLPFFEFSYDNSLFVSNIATSVGGGYAIVSVSDEGLGPIVEVGVGDSTSPSQWSSNGNYLMYTDAGSGWAREINADGTAEEALVFSGYGYDCPILWFSSTELVANNCSDDGVLLFGTVGDSSIGTTEYPDAALTELVLDPSLSCLAGFDETSLWVGTASVAGHEQHPVATLGGVLTWVDFAPDASNVVWTEDGTSQYRIELVDCVPTGEPIEMSSSSNPVQSAAFVTAASK